MISGLLPLVALVLLVLLATLGFLRNLRAARATKLPYFCMPISHDGIIWLFTARWHRSIIARLPLGFARRDWVQLWHRSWRFPAKYNLHRKYGDVFIVVSPAGLSIEVADASVATKVLGLPKPTWPYRVLDLYGANLVSTQGKTWLRHRRAVAPQFNHRVYQMVWAEGLRAATGLIETLMDNLDSQQGTVAAIGPDIQMITLRVILRVGLGLDSSQGNDKRYTSLMTDITRVIDNFATLLVFPKFALKYGPEHWRSLYQSFTGVRALLQEAINPKSLAHNKQCQYPDDTHSNHGHSMVGNLLGQETIHAGKKTGEVPSSVALSGEEIMGNVFILAFAGANTTADVINYSLALLAMHPDIQDWVIDDIDRALGDQSSNPQEWEYDHLFPNLVAPLCVMLETLRLFPANTAITKSTGTQSQTIQVNEATYIFPANAVVNISLNALHHNTKYWGTSPETYRPQNWDSRCPFQWTATHAPDKSEPIDTKTAGASPSTRVRAPPEKGCYLPFSDGPRGCIGKRFSEVEFVAVLTLLLRKFRVQIPSSSDRSWEEARAEVKRVLDESFTSPTLTIQQPVTLQFIRRGG